jgi:DNA-binding MarR family transcriptional regulator
MMRLERLQLASCSCRLQAGAMASRADIAHRRKQADTALELSRINREMERRVQQLLEHEKLADVTPAQANAMMILFQEKAPMTARQLARQMNLSEVTVGRFVRALERAGWLEREADPKDTRAILVEPSAKAYRAFPRFLNVSNALLDVAFAGFTRQEVEALGKLVERVRMNVVVED